MRSTTSVRRTLLIQRSHIRITVAWFRPTRLPISLKEFRGSSFVPSDIDRVDGGERISPTVWISQLQGELRARHPVV
ncbi:hypothetical protein TNCV_3656481 [Trichonephila clavipes]|nr:hypothetical protein TNCV_3656481 [Trichonephila clavipes]